MLFEKKITGMQKNNGDMVILSSTYVSFCQNSQLSIDNVFPIYTFTCMAVTSPCILGPSFNEGKALPTQSLLACFPSLPSVRLGQTLHS